MAPAVKLEGRACRAESKLRCQQSIDFFPMNNINFTHEKSLILNLTGLDNVGKRRDRDSKYSVKLA